MKHENIKKVVILGGGTAGWMSAAYLNKAFSKTLSVTVVESKDIKRIGVGEATVPTLRATIDFLGIDENDWIAKCNGGFKNAIRFENWRSGPNSKDYFYHPFHHYRGNYVDLYGFSYHLGLEGQIPLSHFWLRDKLTGLDRGPFAYACSPNAYLSDKNKAPRKANAKVSSLNYAYHLDAYLFGNYLKDLASTRGVSHVEGEYVSSLTDEHGQIVSLKLKDGRVIEGDFFIDCSGFRSLLIEGVLKEKFLSQSDHLLCDSAVALQVPYTDSTKEFHSYTSAIAMEAGWTWQIPLQNRIGAGYVFSSKHSDFLKAESEIRALMGEKRCSNLEPFHIKFRSGHFPNLWAKNCVAIGLAGAFLEPLESTGIFFIEYQLFQLVKHFPNKKFHPSLARQYNKKFQECFFEVRDFVCMHYILSKRQDTSFWRDATLESRIPTSLKEKLELFKERWPLESDFSSYIFGAFNYSCILAGFDYFPDSVLPAISYLEKDDSDLLFSHIKQQSLSLDKELPLVRDFCKEIQVRTES
ncbi:MAG: tryptophan 7-halogenase [Oligoflexia bacterium]|nr:tryptophan 7-halogenase [Oligoflexia bacterium]